MTMTYQRALEINWQHFVVGDGQPSYDPVEQHSLYQGPNGTQCALRLLVDHVLEDGLPGGFYARELGFQVEPDGSPVFWDDLQRCHDGAAVGRAGVPCWTGGTSFKELMRFRLTRLARSYNLQLPTQES